MPESKHFLLNNGYMVPAMGIGSWMGKVGGGDEVANMIQYALQIGYRHIDTAFGYENEKEVGEGIRKSAVPREELFITTKLHSLHHDSVEEAIDMSLRNLDCQYIDLYLIHWPQAFDKSGQVLQPDQYPTIVDTWKQMETLLPTGKVKSIGVSNFSIKTLGILLAQASVVPAINQVEMHPMLPQMELLSYCKAKSILLTAYTPLGASNDLLMKHPTVTSVANRLNCTAAQVILSWAIIRGTTVVPKTANKHRLEENFVFVDLSPEDMIALDDIHRAPGMHRGLFDSPPGVYFGWTVEQLGWPVEKEGRIIS